MEEQRYWDEVIGYISEYKVDKRWTLRSNIDDKAHGSLRIVSHPDLKAGHLRAMVSFVISRKPKTQEEIEFVMEEYQMTLIELEAYSFDENIVTRDIEHVDTYQELEKRFGVEIFRRKKR